MLRPATASSAPTPRTAPLPPKATLALALALAVLLLAGPGARADSVADEADYRFNRATALYRAGKLEDALGEYLFSNRLVHNKNVLFDIARCYEQLKKFNEAYRWYADILGERDLPAPERDSVQAALQRLAPALALARIESDPAGATVYVGRRDLGARGKTPVTLALPPGTQAILLERDGYKPLQEQVPLEVGKTVHFEQDLALIVGRVGVSAEPARFDLRVDSADAAPLLHSAGTLKLTPGSHTLFFDAPGYQAKQQEVEVVADDEVPVHLTLAALPPPSGSIVLRANVDGALLTIDGKAAGFSPTVVYAVEVGKHHLAISADNHEPVELDAEVREGQATNVEPRLGYALPRVVAAERQLTLASDAPSSITLITSQEIRAFGWLTLAEALRSVRGLTTTDDRGYTSLGVRGYAASGTYNNRLLVLSDGHVTNDLSLGQGFIGQDFDTDLADVERIEVVRGAGAVHYGSAAFLAVVNVVHKTPAAGVHGAVSATVLDQSGLGAQLSAAGDGKWIALHAGGFRSDGERVFTSPVATGPASGTAQNVDGERASHVDLRARLGDFSLAGSFNQRSKDLPTAPFDTVFGKPGTDVRDTRFFGELSWARTFASGVSADARVSYDGRRHDSALQLKAADTNDTNAYPGSNGRLADWVDAEARLRLPPLWGNRLFLGAQLQEVARVQFSSLSPAASISGATQAPDTDYSGQIFSVYGGDDLKLGERVQLDAAVRVDSYGDSFGTIANPRIALIAQPYLAGNFKLMYGTAFRAPSYYERFFTNGASQIPGNRCDSAGLNCIVLQPETVRTGEFEHTHKFDDALSLLVAGYWSRIASILRLAGVGGGKFAFGNRPTPTRSAGLEAEGRWQPAPGMMVSAWYAWARVTNENGFIVPNVPKHTAALRALWPLFGELLSVSGEAIWASHRYTAFVNNANLETLVGESLTLNLGLSGQTRSGLRYSAVVQNLLDQTPLEPAGLEQPFLPKAVPQPGRALRATIGGSF